MCVVRQLVTFSSYYRSYRWCTTYWVKYLTWSKIHTGATDGCEGLRDLKYYTLVTSLSISLGWVIVIWISRWHLGSVCWYWQLFPVDRKQAGCCWDWIVHGRLRLSHCLTPQPLLRKHTILMCRLSHNKLSFSLVLVKWLCDCRDVSSFFSRHQQLSYRN